MTDGDILGHNITRVEGLATTMEDVVNGVSTVKMMDVAATRNHGSDNGSSNGDSHGGHGKARCDIGDGDTCDDGDEYDDHVYINHVCNNNNNN